MESQENSTSPVGAIADAISSIFSAITGIHLSKHGRSVDPLNPTDFQRQSYTIDYIVGAAGLVIIVIVIAIAVVASKK